MNSDLRPSFSTLVSCFVLAAALFSASAGARDQVCVYEDKDYEGDELCLSHSVADLEEEGWNDTISSIEIEGDLEVVLYENAGYKGKSLKLSGSASSIRRGLDDKVSSIEIVGSDGGGQASMDSGGEDLSSKYPASEGWKLQQYCNCATNKRCYVRSGETGGCVTDCPSGCKN